MNPAMMVLMIAMFSGLSVGPVEPVGEGYTFSEGPLWTSEGIWIFSDVAANTIYAEDRSVVRAPSGGANGLALDRTGHVIACEGSARRVTRLEADGTVTVLARGYSGKRFNAPNDLVVRSDGTIFFTDPQSLRKDAESELGFSGVYAITPDGQLILLTDEFKYPNGIALSPDEKKLYVSDTTKAAIRVFDLDGTTLRNGREFCSVRIPDGMAVDASGRVWSTSSGGVSVYDETGAHLETIRIPVMPTNCAFGGEDGQTLFVTARKKVFKLYVSSE